MRPTLLLQHVDGYGSLLAEEIERWSDAWKRRIGLGVIVAGGLLTSALLAGVAVIVHASSIAMPPERIWVLIVVPMVPLLLALGALAIIWTMPPIEAFAELRRQANADLALLKELPG